MKILDLINIMILNEFNQFKTLVKNTYSSCIKYGYLILDVNNILNIYNFEKSCAECIKLMKIWINYGLVEKDSYYEELTIKIDF
jgi:hypothetical protein